MIFVMAQVFVLGCEDKIGLAEHSFGPVDNKTSKASAVNVISMGRDDDDGKAKKWHIGGSQD